MLYTLLLLAQPHLTDQAGDPLPPGAVARLGTMRLRSQAATRDLAYTPDGKWLLSARTDRVVQFWDATTGAPGQQLRQEVPFFAFALSANGKVLVTLANDGLRVWDIATAKLRRLIPVPPAEIAATSTETPSVAITPDGETAAVGLRDKRICLWTLRTGAVTQHLLGHEQRTLLLQFTPDGRSLITFARWSLRGWDLATGRTTFAIDKVDLDGLAIAPDGKTLATAGGRFEQNVRRGEVILRDVATGRELRRCAGHGHFANAIAFAADGKTLASAEPAKDAHTALVHIWDTATGKELQRVERPDNHWVRRLAFSPDGATLALAGSPILDRIDLRTGKVLPNGPNRHDGLAIAFAPDGGSIVTADFGTPVFAWNAATGRLTHTVPNPGPFTARLAFTPDGAALLAASKPDQQGGGVRLLNATGKLLHWFAEQTEDDGLGFAFSPDGKRLTVASTGRLAVWEWASGKLLSSRKPGWFPAPPDEREVVNRLALSSDGTLLAEWARRGVRLWDTATLEEHRWLPVPAGEKATDMTTFSPSGALVAGQTYGGWVESAATGWRWTTTAIQIWETASAKPVLHFAIPRELTALGFSPDGRLLVGVSDGCTHIWDVATGRELLALTGQDGAGSYDAMSFAPDGTRVAVYYRDTTALVWDLRPARAQLALVKKPEAERLWNDLAGDSVTAHAAISTLIAAPETALPVLRERLRAAPSVDARRLREWLDQLDSADFDTREAATLALTRLDRAPALPDALAKATAAETRRRLEAILVELRGPAPATSLRELRAVEVLERIGTTEARRLLAIVAEGDPAARSTLAARAALARLGR